MRDGTSFRLPDLIVVTVIALLFVAFFFPGCRSRSRPTGIGAAVEASRGVADMTRCVSNLEQLGKAFAVYVSSNDDCLPPVVSDTSRYGRKAWMDLIRPALDLGTLDDGRRLLDEYHGPDWERYSVFDCPGNRQTERGGGRFDYAYNRNCAGRNVNTLRAAEMVLLHCANHYAPDPVNGRIANPGIHENGFDNYLFGDGHVENSDTHYKRAADDMPWLATW